MKNSQRHDDAIESNVIAALEEQRLKSKSKSKSKDAAATKEQVLSRIAHLPFLVQKMKSKARLNRKFSLPGKHDDIALVSADNNSNSKAPVPSSTRGSKSLNNDRKSSTNPPVNRSSSRGTPHDNNNFIQTASDQDAFLTNAFHLTELMEDDDASSMSSLEMEDDDDAERNSCKNGAQANEQSNLLKHKRSRSRTCGERLKARVMRWIAIVNQDEVKVSLDKYIHTEVLWGMLPLLFAAFFLFYLIGDPDLEFLPSTATLAWYLIFAVRLQLTFALARVTQFLLELATIRTSTLAQTSGPLVALTAMQSIGWPFLLQAWGGWNILLMHGHHPFCKHWLEFTGISIFTMNGNPDGDGILQSETYGRILFAMVFIGIASAIKRTAVALFLSRRMLRNYRPQLEKLMSQVQLIAGVAGLAEETNKPGFYDILADIDVYAGDDDDVESIATAVSTQVQIERTPHYMDSVPMFSAQAVDENTPSGTSMNESPDMSYEEQWKNLKDQAIADKTGRAVQSTPEHGRSSSVPVNEKGSTKTTFDNVFDSLDRYEAPSTSQGSDSQPESATLNDILQFKKAQGFMTDGYPFTTAFGPGTTRRICVRSAIEVFRKLQKFVPIDKMSKEEADSLTFNVIGALAYTEDGLLDETRAQGLLRLFLPDKNNCVDLNAFVQTCDNVYKQVLFLSASMANSSKIDSVLEDMFNVAYYGVLAVFVLSLLGLNPWPLLVSFSTMMLSLAFALGPSCAKTIEGVLAIALRRPFDLGDRISLAAGLATSTPGLGNTWIVEDINLTTTTLRYAGTNEVSSINNSSLSTARIVNCARSPKATIRFQVMFGAAVVTPALLKEYRNRLEGFLRDRPQKWASMIQFANDGVGDDDGGIIYRIGVQHVHAWQEMGKIVADKGELEQESQRLSKEMGLYYSSPSDRMKVELSQNKASVC